jgi:hypothetical protein
LADWYKPTHFYDSFSYLSADGLTGFARFALLALVLLGGIVGDNAFAIL